MKVKSFLLFTLLVGVLAAMTTAPAAAEGPNAVRPDAGCNVNVLNRNDDGSIGAVDIGFDINFFGLGTNQVFVNNNGNVTLGGPLGTFTPFGLTGATGTPIIAPFFADVDTRGAGSDIVRFSWGGTTIDGREAFCVNWVNVGYYNSQFDKLNSFQLVLVDRSDVGAGDFDIEFNYDKVQWETGSASGGSGGFGGTSAGVGFSRGTGVAGTFFELPGSRMPGSFLNSNTLTGLIHGSRNTLQQGRYIFPVRNGLAPVGGTIGGTVRDGAGNPLSGAPVQVCPASGGLCAFVTSSNSAGNYNASGLPPNDYDVTAYPPAGTSFSPNTEGPLSVALGSSTTQDIVLTGPVGPPAGTSVNGTSGTIPVVVIGAPIHLETTGCDGGAATYTVTGNYGGSVSGALVEGPAGTYAADFTLSFTGPATVTIVIDGCPTIEFNIYIDPSGFVLTPGGNSVEGATVTLFRSDSPSGPFVQVPDGSAIMSPANRANPDTTDATGHFGWDTIAGYYLVRAEKEGCHAPGDSSILFVETAVLTIPPPVTDIDLRLAGPACPDDVTPPTVTLTMEPSANGNGWHRGPVDVVASADDGPTGSGVASITCGATTEEDDELSFEVSAEGVTTFSCTAIDRAGNRSEPVEGVVRIDLTPPSMRCPSPLVLSPPNHRLQQVALDVGVSDGLSGPDGFRLTAASSDEPDNGLGDGDRPNDLQGWTIGSADVTGLVRVERSGLGDGRRYSFRYVGADLAGNEASCVAVVKVPHSR